MNWAPLVPVVADWVHWWLQAAAILLVLASGMWLSARAGLALRASYWALVCGIVGALIGGELWAAFCDALAGAGFKLSWSGGQGVIGVFTGGLVAGLFALHGMGKPPLRYADAVVPAVALGYAVARVACLLAGDDFGMPTPGGWGIRFGPGSEAYAYAAAAALIEPAAVATLPLHPTQLYHALLGLIGCVILLRMRSTPPGRRLAAALMIYGAGRFVIEFYRGDALPIWGPLDVNHLAALTMLVAGTVLWRRVSRPADGPVGSDSPVLAPVHD